MHFDPNYMAYQGHYDMQNQGGYIDQGGYHDQFMHMQQQDQHMQQQPVQRKKKTTTKKKATKKKATKKKAKKKKSTAAATAAKKKKAAVAAKKKKEQAAKKKTLEKKKAQKEKDKIKAKKAKEREKAKAAAARKREKEKKKKAVKENTITKKHPNAPKRAKTAYICYMSAIRPEIKEQLGGDSAKVTEIVKEIADRWKKMSPEDQAHWNAQAAEDKARYDQEMANYSGPMVIKSKRPKKGQRRRGTKKDKNAPKRSPSAFLLYSKELRPQLQQQNPDLKNTEISKKLGEMWRGMSDEDRVQWYDKAKEEAEKYKKAKEEYALSLAS